MVYHKRPGAAAPGGREQRSRRRRPGLNELGTAFDARYSVFRYLAFRCSVLGIRHLRFDTISMYCPVFRIPCSASSVRWASNTSYPTTYLPTLLAPGQRAEDPDSLRDASPARWAAAIGPAIGRLRIAYRVSRLERVAYDMISPVAFLGIRGARSVGSAPAVCRLQLVLEIRFAVAVVVGEAGRRRRGWDGRHTEPR